MSLVIGVVCSVLAWALALPSAVDGVLAWLGYVNLILLVFNRVRDCMIPLEQVPRLRPNDDAADALPDLSGKSVNRGLVLDDGRLVGIISAADLGRALEVRPRTLRTAA